MSEICGGSSLYLTSNNYTVQDASSRAIAINNANKATVTENMANAIKNKGNTVSQLAASLGVDATKFNHYCLWYESKHGNSDGTLDATELAKAIINLDKADGKLDGNFTGAKKVESIAWAEKEYLNTHPSVNPEPTPPEPKPEPEPPAPEPNNPKPTLWDVIVKNKVLIAGGLMAGALLTWFKDRQQNRQSMPPQPVFARSMPPSNQNLFGGVPFNGGFHGVMMG